MRALQIFNIVLVILMALFLFYKKKIGCLWIRKQKFKCTRCGKCCSYLVNLNKKDIKKIEKKGHTDFMEYKDRKPVLKRNHGFCTFFKFENGKAVCTIYDYRPKVCKNFPRVHPFGVKAWDTRSSAFKVPRIFK